MNIYFNLTELNNLKLAVVITFSIIPDSTTKPKL